MLAVSASLGPVDSLTVLANTPWWPPAMTSGPTADLISRLWRNSVAVSVAARWLASDAGDSDPEAVARAGLLCRLGYWAVAAVDAEWLVHSWRTETQVTGRASRFADFELDLDDLGRRLAERWGCERLVVDAAWLHADHGYELREAACEPERLTYIQEACRWAEQTPWALGAKLTQDRPVPQHRLRILVAEVQARASAAFVPPDTTVHEERLMRQNARLSLALAAERQARLRADRFLQALADFSPDESQEEWGSRAALAWCGEPEVTAARVDWVETPPSGLKLHQAPAPAIGVSSKDQDSGEPPAPTVVLPLHIRGRVRAIVSLWASGDAAGLEHRVNAPAARGAWEKWAALVEDRELLRTRLQHVVESFRRRLDTEDSRLEDRKLDALSEFAAGAGHELNNPLAVIAGRAQLLLARTGEPEFARSLRIMLSQATRAHRILRDLIFVARPPAPRPRACRPSELLREILKSFHEDCVARQIRLTSEIDDAVQASWFDPDQLRQIGEILLRNAIEATPTGGTIHVGSRVRSGELHWWFSDNGKGITALEAPHIFEPFYCGRQAGRGLGLGLPRVARIVALAQGRIDWSSNPGQGTLFQVYLPIPAPPEAIHQPAAAVPGSGSTSASTPSPHILGRQAAARRGT
jgi:signal transduction histidine kinase